MIKVCVKANMTVSIVDAHCRHQKRMTHAADGNRYMPSQKNQTRNPDAKRPERYTMLNDQNVT